MSSPIFNKQNYDASVGTLRVVSFFFFFECHDRISLPHVITYNPQQEL